MTKVKKAQLGDTLNIKRTIGDSVALKQKADSVGISTLKAKEALAKRIAAKKKAKDGKWIQKATASIKKRGTKGVCTGSKFGGPTCKPGSKRYNLAKTFKAMSKKK